MLLGGTLAEVGSPQPVRGRQLARDEFAGSQAGRSGQGLGRRLLCVPTKLGGPCTGPRDRTEPRVVLSRRPTQTPPGTGRACQGRQLPLRASEHGGAAGEAGTGWMAVVLEGCWAVLHGAAVLALPPGSPALGPSFDKGL